uniref:Putative ovule protein n=1 Tax=Solanum chacoense TaxID=4108 RepID=A0A0V0HB30_SOLCH
MLQYEPPSLLAFVVNMLYDKTRCYLCYMDPSYCLDFGVNVKREGVSYSFLISTWFETGWIMGLSLYRSPLKYQAFGYDEVPTREM